MENWHNKKQTIDFKAFMNGEVVVKGTAELQEREQKAMEDAEVFLQLCGWIAVLYLIPYAGDFFIGFSATP
jgi:hypothetical protein